MLKVLIADDHEIVRRGIMQVLLEEFPNAFIVTVADTASLVEKAGSENWDIILSDISMPGGGGLVATNLILRKSPQLRILIVSAFGEEIYAARILKAGAWGFLSKDRAADELVIAVKMILSGRRYISLSEKIVSELLQKKELLPHELLDQLEWNILQLYTSGCSVSDISTKLSYNKNTIETLLLEIIKKMNLETEAGLLKYAADNKLN